MKTLTLKAKKRIVESDASATIDPNLQALFDAVSELEAKNPGSTEKFIKIAQSKYGIKSKEDLKKGMSLWLKVPAAGLSLAGFLGSIVMAITTVGATGMGATGILQISAGGVFLNPTTFGIGAAFASLAWVCTMLTFIFWKIFRYILSRPRKTEGINPTTTKEYDDVLAKKTILECDMLMQQLCSLTENNMSPEDAKETIKKSDGLCRKMFAWIKEKFKSGGKWVVKHPFIIVAFLIVIGFVFCGSNNIKPATTA